jgi:outer membrane protein assembly factor BamA
VRREQRADVPLVLRAQHVDVDRLAFGERAHEVDHGGLPDLSIAPGGAVSANRYVPVGGLARLTGSLELGMPFPFAPDVVRSFVFIDAGRVWTPGDDFQPGDPELALEPWAFGTGVGIQIGSPFGPVRIGVGYKLNPTRVDLLPPGDVARALAAGEGLGGLTPEPFRRWHLHLTIGQTL